MADILMLALFHFLAFMGDNGHAWWMNRPPLVHRDLRTSAEVLAPSLQECPTSFETVWLCCILAIVCQNRIQILTQ